MKNVNKLVVLLWILAVINPSFAYHSGDPELDEDENPDDDPVASDCPKRWIVADPPSEISDVGQYAGHVASVKRKYEYEDILIRVIKGVWKDCKNPRFRFEALYGVSNCRTNQTANECKMQPNSSIKYCQVYVWVPEGKGGRLAQHDCVTLYTPHRGGKRRQ